jgi:hypothetical protein
MRNVNADVMNIITVADNKSVIESARCHKAPKMMIMTCNITKAVI